MKRTPALYSWLLLIAVAIAMFFFAYYNVWMGDDILYMLNFADGFSTYVTSVSDIIESQNTHYIIWNGRYVAHFLVQLFCGIFGQTVFAVANGLIYIAYFYLMARLCGVRISNFRGVLSIVLLALIAFQTKIVPSTQIGYIWMYALVMLFIYLFLKESNRAWRWWQILLAGVLSLLAGESHESLVVGIGAALIVYWAMNMRKMSLAQYIMMICFGIGGLILCLAPGNFRRLSYSGASFVAGLFLHIKGLLVFSRMTYVLFAIVIWRLIKKTSLKKILQENIFYWTAWVTLVIFFFLAGYYVNRCLFGIELISLILSVRMMRGHAMNKFWIAVAAAILIVSYCLQIDLARQYHVGIKEIVDQYEKSEDGAVYYDLDYNKHIPNTAGFVDNYRLYRGLTPQTAKYLYHRYTGGISSKNDTLRILPEMVKGKESVNLENQMLTSSIGKHFAIINKENPKRLYVLRNVHIPMLFNKEYPPMEIEVNDSTADYSSEKWYFVYLECSKYMIGDEMICDTRFELR